MYRRALVDPLVLESDFESHEDINSVEQIAKGYTVHFEYDEEESDVSIYTPKVFSTYGWINV